ncbi:MAG: EAL domain-containing protein [Rhizobacter sp.]
MLTLIMRAIGQLPVGRKLLLIYLLDLTAVIYVSGILISEKYIAIDFSRKEVAGNAYIAEVRDVLVALPTPLPPLAPDEVKSDAAAPHLDRATWEPRVAALRDAELRHGQGMKSGDVSAAFAAALEAAMNRPDFDAGQLAASMAAGRDLITRIGNQSNLILDPDLDSYYTMSLVLLRFPELQELLALTVHKAVELSQSPADHRNKQQTELLILEGRLDAVLKGIDSDYEEALSAGPPTLRATLEPTHKRLAAAVTAFRQLPAQLDAYGSADRRTVIFDKHREVLAELHATWRAAATGLDGLLDARIRGLFLRMWMHLGTAVALLMLILNIVYFVARQIAQPLQRLADVAGRVSASGDYTMRAAHDSRDEIGQLVQAFNGMLGDLDRDRAVREDLTATTRAEEAQRALLESFPMPLIVTSIPEHRVLHANQPAQPWLQGVTTDPWSLRLDPQARTHFFSRLSDTERVDGFEVQWLSDEGRRGGSRGSWALLSARRLSYQGQPALLTVFTPIGQIKMLEQRLKLWAKVFEASSESIVIFDVERRILTANTAFSRDSGWGVEEIVGQTPEFLYSSRHETDFYETLWQSAIIRGLWQGEVWLKRKTGEAYPTWLVANAVRDSDGRITHFVAAGADITEHKASEERIHHLAHHDVLTDLPNRSLCLERLRMAVEQAGRTSQHVGVVFIDLDRFKNINDSMGHHVGDALLRSVSKRLLSAVRAGDTVSRLGGDEFVVVLNGVGSVDEISAIVVERMLPLVREPHVVEGVQLHVSCSAGMAVYPQDGRDIDHLMRHADAAMYQAKSRGRDHALFFTPQFHIQAQERLAIENELRDVTARGELLLHFQPRVDARSGDVMGVEALVRWQRPEHGLVSPATFIPIAEETGQIVPIGAWILGEACRQHAAWRDAGLGAIPISVNVSAIQLRDPELPAQLREVLEAHRVDPSAIELELTETFLMENAIATVESLERLKDIGVTLSIDDFGTGYSSLNYLHQFPIDKLKIDQSFVRDILEDPADWAITQAIIGLGHTLGLRVVAEGVERIDEAHWLRDAGCDELQGYLFSKPMPPGELEAWLRGRLLAPGAPARTRLRVTPRIVAAPAAPKTAPDRTEQDGPQAEVVNLLS